VLLLMRLLLPVMLSTLLMRLMDGVGC